MNKAMRHYEESAQIPASAAAVFAYADNHANFSSHMNTSSWMMGGGSMEMQVDEGNGQKVGSHIRMRGKVFGITWFVDEIVTQHEPPYHKEWETVGDINLLVIGHHSLGFNIEPEDSNSKFTVHIDYNLPRSAKTRIPGSLLGAMYAKWCVGQMVKGVSEHFIAIQNKSHRI